MSKTELDSILYLSSISKNYFQLTTKIAIITFGKQACSQTFGFALLLIEYLQLISQTFLIAFSYNDELTADNSFTYQIMTYIAKSIDPGSWFDIYHQKVLTMIIFSVFTLIVIFKYLIFLYVTIIVKFDLKGSQHINSLWSWICKVQGRVMCFFITSLYFKIISGISQDEFDGFGINKMTLLIVSLLMIALEYSLSFFLQALFGSILPSKSFLASKSNLIETINLLQKLTNQILKVSNLQSASWAFSLPNLVFTLLRETYYFSTLPLYNFKALKYQAILGGVTTSLNLSFISQIIIKSAGYQTNIKFVIVFWIVLTSIIVKILKEHFKRIVINIINSKTGSPEYLVHKITMIKYLRKKKKTPSHKNRLYELTYFLDLAVNASICTILPVQSADYDEKTLDLNSKESINKLCLVYLETLLLKFPKSGFLKLYTAYFCAHKLQYFSTAIKIIANIKKSYAGKLEINASMLTYEMQNKLANQIAKETENISLTEYIENLTKVAQLKFKMLKQAEAQNSIYNEILSDVPDLQKIFKNGQMVGVHAASIQKEIKNTLKTLPDTYIEPLLVCAHYSLALNYSLTDYVSYYKKYLLKYKKYDKFFKKDKLVEENLFQDTNIFIMISGQKSDIGKIFYCSRSIEKTFGNLTESYIGTNVTSLATPNLQSYYLNYFKTLADRGERALFTNVIRGFGYNIQGYMTEVDFCTDFHPFMTQNFCFNIIVRAVPSNKEYILLLENGDIEGATHEVWMRLGLQDPRGLPTKRPVNIRLISEELGLVNHAFNLVALPDKYRPGTTWQGSQRDSRRRLNGYETVLRKNSDETVEPYMSQKKAEEIYSIYTTKGKKLSLISINNNTPSDTYSCRCTVRNQFYGSLLIKIVTLEEDIMDELEDLQDESTTLVKEKLTKHEKEPDISESENESRTKSKDEESFSFPEENQTGWINFKALESPGNFRMFSPSSERENGSFNQAENVISTEERFIPNLGPKVLTFCKISKFSRINKTTKSQSRLNQGAESSNREDKKEFHTAKSLKIEDSKAASHRMKNSLHVKISNAYRVALTTEHNPNYFKVVCVLFYLSLIGIFLSQINLKGTLDSIFEFIKTSKEIVNNAEMRNFLLVTIQQTCRLIWDIATGVLNSKNMSFYRTDKAFYIFLLNNYIKNLAKTNNDLFTSMKSLEEHTTNVLFMKDVRIYETYFNETTQIYSDLDNFQATSKVIQTALKGIGIMKQNIITSQKEIQFLLRNTVNDLLIKNEMTSDILMESVNSKQNYFTTTVNIYLIITISLLGGLALVFIWATWNQFQIENFNLCAILKLNTNQIKNNIDKINEFKNILYGVKNLDPNLNQCTLDIPFQRLKMVKDQAGKVQIKAPKNSGIINKYCSYALILLLLTSTFAGLIIWYSISNTRSVEFFQRKQAQFFFINRLKSQLSLAVTMSQELFAGNGTTLTHNQPNCQQFPLIIRNVDIMKNNITEIFRNEDDTYDAQIEAILFNDGCPFVGQVWLIFCQAFKNKGMKPGLIYAISELQVILYETHQNFLTVNKSAELLTIQEAKSYEALSLPYYVAISECDAVALSIGEILENDILVTLKSRNLAYIIFAFVFIMLSSLIWFFVINPLREANNRFKKVLQAFPADLVLSSFLLRSFLITSSKDALNSVKNDL